jgi:hypothetical protein
MHDNPLYLEWDLGFLFETIFILRFKRFGLTNPSPSLGVQRTILEARRPATVSGKSIACHTMQ